MAAFVLEGGGSDLGRYSIDESQDVRVGENQVLVKIEKCAFTANVVSYAIGGQSLGYFRFFPREDEEKVSVPSWGIGRVVASRHEKVREGELLYGMFPFNQLVVLSPDIIRDDALIDLSPHRKDLSVIYNTYSRLHSGLDPFYTQPQDKSALPEEILQDLLVTLRPLFLTSWLLKEYVSTTTMPNGGQLFLTSGSSKTSYSLAFLMKHCLLKDQQGGRKFSVVGLTSRGNKKFVQGLGVYDKVVVYDEIASSPVSLDGLPNQVIDMSGNASVLNQIIKVLPDTICTLVGATHIDDVKEGNPLPGKFFFAPSEAAKITKRIGPAVFQKYVGEDWHAFIRHVFVNKWCKIEHRNGFQAMLDTWKSAISKIGVDPSAGVILSLAQDHARI